MSVQFEERSKAIDILEHYSGTNPYILNARKDVCLFQKTNVLNDFTIEYILMNAEREPRSLGGRLLYLCDWFAVEKQKEWGTEFIPNRIKVAWYMGETSTIYHVYGQYRQSVPPFSIFIPKRAVLKDFLLDDYHNVQVDFDRYDRLAALNIPNHNLKDHQKEAVQFLLSRKKCILADDMGMGKLEPLSAIIPTPNGFTKMGDLSVGDKVFGWDGKPATITQIFPHKDKEIYRVAFSDGTSMECGLEHLFVVRDANMRIRNKGWKTASLQELLKSGLQYNDEKRKIKGLNPRNKWEIPICDPVEYEKKEYLIHPYVLGLCIGDGNLCNGGIHISVPDNEKEDIERVRQLLPQGLTLSENRSSVCPRYTIINEIKSPINVFNREVEHLGLNVKENEKFIPSIYRFGSHQQRLELLRGLMDSDGTITKSQNKISFFTNSAKLAEDVRELVYSLGGTARIRSYSRKNKNTEYIVSIQIKENPFHLSRKAERYNPSFKKYCTKYIVSAEYVRNEDAQCIMVDNETHTYLTGRHYIVTHNTTSLSVASIEGNFDCILVICPASLKSNWVRELGYYVPQRDISVIGGVQDFNKDDLEKYLGYGLGRSGKTVAELKEEAKERGKWTDNRYVIINFDILKDVYEMPKTKRSKTPVGGFNRPMLDFLKNKKSLIIIDEAHKLSNDDSGRIKIVKDLVEEAKPHSIYLSTGTPITNDPGNYYNLLSIIGADIAADYNYYTDYYCEVMKIPINQAQKDKRDKIQNSFIYKKGKENWYQLTNEEKKELAKKLDGAIITRKVIKGGKNLEELRDKTAHLYLRRLKDELDGLPAKHTYERFYDLDAVQMMEYNKLWDEYVAGKEIEYQKELEEYRKYEEELLEYQARRDPNMRPPKAPNPDKSLLSGGIYRQYLSEQMVPHTLSLCDRSIAKGEKVVIACCYDNELNKIVDYYGDRCVKYNGKMTLKEKDEAINKFMNDPNVMVFVGNIIAAGVGITLVASRVLIFNNISWVPGDNNQMQDRIHRIGQKREVHIFYQLFRDTQYEVMWDKVLRKSMMIDQVIKGEKDKQ